MHIFKLQAYPLEENATAVVVLVIISISDLQITDLRDPDKSRYIGLTDFNNCFLIPSPVCFQFEIHLSQLKEAICHVSQKSVVLITHDDQNIMCRKRRLDGTTHELSFIGVY